MGIFVTLDSFLIFLGFRRHCRLILLFLLCFLCILVRCFLVVLVLLLGFDLRCKRVFLLLLFPSVPLESPIDIASLLLSTMLCLGFRRYKLLAICCSFSLLFLVVLLGSG